MLAITCSSIHSCVKVEWSLSQASWSSGLPCPLPYIPACTCPSCLRQIIFNPHSVFWSPLWFSLTVKHGYDQGCISTVCILDTHLVVPGFWWHIILNKCELCKKQKSKENWRNAVAQRWVLVGTPRWFGNTLILTTVHWTGYSLRLLWLFYQKLGIWGCPTQNVYVNNKHSLKPGGASLGQSPCDTWRSISGLNPMWLPMQSLDVYGEEAGCVNLEPVSIRTQIFFLFLSLVFLHFKWFILISIRLNIYSWHNQKVAGVSLVH